jgi:hypothetical protein
MRGSCEGGDLSDMVFDFYEFIIPGIGYKQLEIFKKIQTDKR